MNGSLTVVVTIYKVEAYLRKCLDSLREQTYSNFCVLLIVGSKDDACIDICQQYIVKDSRFKMIISEPKGLSDARNVGIIKTETEFITFVDGDDCLLKTSLEELMALIDYYNCDIAIGNYVRKEERYIRNIREGFKKGLYTNKKALVNFLNGHGIQFVVAWGKIYKTSLFKENNIMYPIGKLHEDNLTTYKLLYHANSIAYTNKPVYCYVKRDGSLSSNINIENEKVILRDIPILRDYVKEIQGLERNIDAYEVGAIISYIVKLAQASDVHYSEYLEFVKELKKIKILQLHQVRLRMKILCIAIIKMPKIMYSVLGI